MKKRISCLALLPCLIGTAYAQSNVSVYGNLDSGLLNVNTPTYRILSQFTSGWVPTYLGFRGTEDLGGGMSMTFRLESGINLSTGSPGQYPPSTTAFFNRASSVTLAGGYGALSVGRTTNVAFLALVNTDPRSISNIGSGLQAWSIGNGSSVDDNSISYATPNLGGLTARAQYGFGEVVNNNKASSTRRVEADYKTGDLVVAGSAFAQSDATGVNTNSGNLLGGSYKFGDITLKGYAATFNSNFQTGPGGLVTPFRLGKLRSLALGGNYAISPLLNVDAGVYTFKDLNNVTGMNATTVAAGLFYKLSARTTLYSQLALINNTGRSTAASALMIQNGANTTASVFTQGNGRTNMVNVGIRHMF